MKTDGLKTRFLRGARVSLVAPLLGIAILVVGCSENEPEPKNQEPVQITSKVEEPTSADDSGCPEGSVAMVDDRVVTVDEAEKRARMNLRREQITEAHTDYPAKLKTARKGAVDYLTEAYILQASASTEMVVDEAAVDEELLQIKMKHPTQESYEEGLRRAELTEEEFKDLLRDDLRIRLTMAAAASRGVPTPTPDETREYYDQNTYLFEWPYRVGYEQVIWPFPADLKEASAEQALAQMEQMADEMERNPVLFDTLIRNATMGIWSPIGNKFEYANTEGLYPEVRDAMQVLDVDEVSRPVRTKGGIHILRIKSTRQPYEAAARSVAQSIYDARVVENLAEWRERRRAKHKVVICDLDYYEGTGEWATAAGETK